MVNRKIIRGRTTKEQMDSIEHALISASRKQPRSARALLPPVPIFLHCNVPQKDGTIGQILIPFDCNVTVALINIGVMKNEEHTLIVQSISGEGSHTINVSLKGALTVFNMN